MIVLVASFGDVTPKWGWFLERGSGGEEVLLGVPPLSLLRLTEEVRGLFAGMGSALVKSVKARDNWVFAGRAGCADRSLYEKVSEHLSTPPSPFYCPSWCWKCPLSCPPVRQPSTKRKPTPTRAGRGRWRLEAVIHGPELTRPRKKKKKNVSPGVAGLLWINQVVPDRRITTAVCPSGICEHDF